MVSKPNPITPVTEKWGKIKTTNIHAFMQTVTLQRVILLKELNINVGRPLGVCCLYSLGGCEIQIESPFSPPFCLE